MHYLGKEIGKIAMSFAESIRFDTERLLESGARGCHVLFDNEMILKAYTQDTQRLYMTLEERFDEIQESIALLLDMDAADASHFFDALAPETRSIIVLLYFEILDTRMRQRSTIH